MSIDWVALAALSVTILVIQGRTVVQLMAAFDKINQRLTRIETVLGIDPSVSNLKKGRPF